jgi:hypothetical protein
VHLAGGLMKYRIRKSISNRHPGDTELLKDGSLARGGRMTLLEQELSHIDISECLKTIEYDAYYNGRNVDVLLSFIPFQNGCIDTDKFLKVIKDQIIIKFVITYREIQKHYRRKDSIEADKDLYDKAIRKITRNTAKGKLGELLLYLFLEKYFFAPKILSKISSLDDNETHVKGADAVHAQYVEGNLVLYLGESKLWKKYNGACSDAVDSIKTTLYDYQSEFDLIETNIDFPKINEDLEIEILNILNPYKTMGKGLNIHTPCFIGFDSSICKSIFSEEDYRKKYITSVQNKIDTFFHKATKCLDIDKITLILLPFESIDAFTEQFVKHLGIKS